MKYLLFILFALPVSAATYYIDYDAGDDSNNGTSTGTAWQWNPYQRGFSGSYGHSAGDRFIFKGGVTWPGTNGQFYTSVGGSSAGNRDYYGVDETWYTGGSWTRPLFDAQTNDFKSFGEGRQNYFMLDTCSYVMIDGLEFANYTWNNPVPTSESDGFAVLMWACTDIIITNCYARDWIVQTATDSKFGGFGSVNGGSLLYVYDSIVKGPDSAPAAEYLTGDGWTSGAGLHGISWGQGCNVSKVTQGIFSGGSFSNCTIHTGGDSYNSASHENAVYMFGKRSLYNSTVYDWTEGICIYMSVGWNQSDATGKVVNCVIWGSGPVPISITEEGTDGGQLVEAWIYNNTIIRNGTAIVNADRAEPPYNVIDIRNNLYVTTQTSGFLSLPGVPTTLINESNTNITPAQAATFGMTVANEYTPSIPDPSFYDAGTNIAVFATDKVGTSRPQDSAWDIGAYEWMGYWFDLHDNTTDGLKMQGP